MNDITAISQTVKIMTTREIAKLTGKQVQHINRDTIAMFKELGIDTSKYGRIYLDSMNRQKIEYELDQELTFTLITGYNIKLRNLVVKRWLEREGRLASLQSDLIRWQAKAKNDMAVGSFHGKGLAERKKTKHLNAKMIGMLSSKIQLNLDL